MTEQDALLRQDEFKAELAKFRIKLSDRMLRYYVTLEFIHPERELGAGNVLFYRRRELEKIRVIQQLVKTGQTLREIKALLNVAKDSSKEVLDFLAGWRHAETLTYIVKQLKQGKKIDELKRDLVVGAKEAYAKQFAMQYAEDYYVQFRNSLFRLLKKYADLFYSDFRNEDGEEERELWSEEAILNHFGFLPLGSVDFNDRAAVKQFKREFYHRLQALLEERQREFAVRMDAGIRHCAQQLKHLGV